MSNKDNEYKGSTLWQLILVIPGTILAFSLIISLIAKTSGSMGKLDASEPATVVAKAVEENIKPVATVEVASADAGPHAAKGGEEVYKAVCSMCHATGLMSAPKFGDKDAWKPRIAQGYETLVSHAINGVRSMPAKGGNPSLIDGEIYNAVAYMANAGGANFTPPAPKEAVVAKSDAPAGKSGEEVYKSVCMMCHAAGLMEAPKFGDKALWAPRIAQGYDTLVNHAVHGIRNMPAKGGNPGLSDQEVAGAVKYMADAGGAKF
ncbi:MAG: c-type cytochrome [Pseudomonadota bacterium]